jgi:ribosomal protein S18 acetylase RimI-like enzyme
VGYRVKAVDIAEGLRLKILYEGRRSVGFIEYTPGEVAWRAVYAQDYLVIHCLWVVGKGKGKGYGSRLLNLCIDDAHAAGKRGVAMVASHDNWLAGPEILLKHGFEVVDQAPPSFDLLAKSFDGGPMPAFPKDWDARLARCGAGVTVLRSDQCPYLVDAVNGIVEDAQVRGLSVQVIDLTSAQQVQVTAPSAYGVFNVVYDGKLVTYEPYHRGGILSLLDQ